jgi:uncharacterized protein YndB with AHSA1/START domain
MASYSFVTEWRLEAPIERVFELLNDATAWPEWWPGVISIDEIRPPTDRNGVGRVLRSTFRGKLPFRLTFDMTVEEVVRPTSLAGRARGELDGVGGGPSARKAQGRWFATTGTSGRPGGG